MSAAFVMSLVVAGFMLAFIDHNERAFFLSILVAPLALVFHGISMMLDPQQHRGAHSLLGRQR